MWRITSQNTLPKSLCTAVCFGHQKNCLPPPTCLFFTFGWVFLFMCVNKHVCDFSRSVSGWRKGKKYKSKCCPQMGGKINAWHPSEPIATEWAHTAVCFSKSATLYFSKTNWAWVTQLQQSYGPPELYQWQTSYIGQGGFQRKISIKERKPSSLITNWTTTRSPPLYSPLSS